MFHIHTQSLHCLPNRKYITFHRNACNQMPHLIRWKSETRRIGSKLEKMWWILFWSGCKCAKKSVSLVQLITIACLSQYCIEHWLIITRFPIQVHFNIFRHSMVDSAWIERLSSCAQSLNSIRIKTHIEAVSFKKKKQRSNNCKKNNNFVTNLTGNPFVDVYSSSEYATYQWKKLEKSQQTVNVNKTWLFVVTIFAKSSPLNEVPTRNGCITV